MIKTTLSRTIRHRAAWYCALALLAAAPDLLAEQAGYYRWKDDKGQFQATQQPPRDRPSEYVRLSTGKSTPVAVGETAGGENSSGAPGVGAPGAGNPSSASPKGQLEGVPERDPEKCQQAKQTQAALNSHARIREKGSDGQYRYLSTEEIEEQRHLARESTEIYCEPDK